MKTQTAHVTFHLTAEQIHKLRHIDGYRCTDHLGSVMFKMGAKQLNALTQQFDDQAGMRKCPQCKKIKFPLQERMAAILKDVMHVEPDICSACGHKLTAAHALRNRDAHTPETIANFGLDPDALAYPAYDPSKHDPLAGIEITSFDALIDECNSLLEDGEEDDVLEAAIADATKAIRRIVKRARQQRAMAEGLVLHG